MASLSNHAVSAVYGFVFCLELQRDSVQVTRKARSEGTALARRGDSRAICRAPRYSGAESTAGPYVGRRFSGAGSTMNRFEAGGPEKGDAKRAHDPD
jgi:hypothetical protein